MALSGVRSDGDPRARGIDGAGDQTAQDQKPDAGGGETEAKQVRQADRPEHDHQQARLEAIRKPFLASHHGGNAEPKRDVKAIERQPTRKERPRHGKRYAQQRQDA